MSADRLSAVLKDPGLAPTTLDPVEHRRLAWAEGSYRIMKLIIRRQQLAACFFICVFIKEIPAACCSIALLLSNPNNDEVSKNWREFHMWFILGHVHGSCGSPHPSTMLGDKKQRLLTPKSITRCWCFLHRFSCSSTKTIWHFLCLPWVSTQFTSSCAQ